VEAAKARVRPQQAPEFEAPLWADSSLHGDDAAERSSGDGDAVVADDAAVDCATSAVAAAGPDAAVERGVAAGGWEDRYGAVAAAESVVGGSEPCLSAFQVDARVGGAVLATRGDRRCC
jgi:hypothetical protein